MCILASGLFHRLVVLRQPPTALLWEKTRDNSSEQAERQLASFPSVCCGLKARGCCPAGNTTPPWTDGPDDWPLVVARVITLTRSPLHPDEVSMCECNTTTSSTYPRIQQADTVRQRPIKIQLSIYFLFIQPIQHLVLACLMLLKVVVSK